MKNSLLILAGAAALSLASCSQEKTTDTTVAAGEGMTTTTTTTTMSPMSEADMEARAQRIADKMVADMKITDEATKTKIRTVYVNRYRQMGDMQTKYATDTTGMAGAMRESMATTDAEFKTIFADPTQYRAYETGRTSYYNMADEDAAMSSGSMNSSSDMNMSGEGGKMKVKADGDIKIKDAEGNKTKMDGDDGTIKMKDESGNKTKMQ
ncbi:hypothetical protein BEN47_10075 [Hymenobacter lapidarius]|uniref:Uncharacterized protein n=1 Tax=Hymenobacter lapidarius TaxID=1908237 RepID=A0A1G1TAI6_9BACT|nr:hypothetical protein [Hymenobacter lapidarius]OGX87875.1 hypothetical protein BEN47_10075 [Hymenobacter lapidarius]